jgi:hypothetical protein
LNKIKDIKLNYLSKMSEKKNDILVVEKILKKRGRKPKDKTETIVKSNIETEESMDNVMILHIPYVEELIEFENNNSNNIIYQEYNYSNDNNNIHSQYLNDILYNKHQNCVNNNELMLTNNFGFNKVNETNSNKKNLNFFNNTLNQRVLYEIDGINDEDTDETNCCYWDTCPFKTKPIGLPYKRIVYKCKETNQMKHKYIVYGKFCSFGCMASYNFSLKDLQMYERFLLINSFYKDTFGVEKLITFAPPVEMLDKFGGPYNITKFRNISDSDINMYYQKIIPPMYSMKCQIEEFYGKLYNKKESDNNNLYKNNLEVHCRNDTSIYLDSERIFKAQERFMNSDKLKKIGNNNDEIKYTIENRMGIILKK